MSLSFLFCSYPSPLRGDTLSYGSSAMRYVSYTGENCGNGLGFVPSCIKIPLFRRYPISLMKIVLIVGIDKHYLLQRYPASLGGAMW